MQGLESVCAEEILTARSHLLVVRYELDLDLALRQVPDRARRVDGARAHNVGIHGVPVKRR